MNTNHTNGSTTWRIKADDRNPEHIDEVVMLNANVHLEDMGDAYMLIVENGDQHIHLTIPHPRGKLAWVFEQYTPTDSDHTEGSTT